MTDLQVAEEGEDKRLATPTVAYPAEDMCSHCLSDPIPQGCREHYTELTTTMPFATCVSGSRIPGQRVRRQ